MTVRGRFPLGVRITNVRSLTKEDLEKLREPRSVHPMKRLRQSHHQLALLGALGYSAAEISKLTGYSQTRILTLRHDPAFSMLMEEKRNTLSDFETKQVADMMAQKFKIMAAMDRHLLDGIEEMDERGELVPMKTALAISADMADRVGYAKHSTHTSYDGDWAKRMEAMINKRGKVINSEAANQASFAANQASSPSPTLKGPGFAPLLDPLETRPQAESAAPSERSGLESPPRRAPLHLITRR